jgi:DNA processing protein
MSSSCAVCARRSELLVRLGISLDFRARDFKRLWETLELSDEQLIAAVGGRKREELRRWHAGVVVQRVQSSESGVERVCRHCEDYPSGLSGDPLAPPEVHVAGGASRLRKLLDGPVVAIVGARRCTDYGMEVARCLGRDLAAAGVCVIGELCEGVSYGGQLGAVEAGGAAVAVVAGGIEKCSPGSCVSLYRQVTATGCLLSELPCGARARIWSEVARGRIVALLAQLVIVVEAEHGSRELSGARLASARSRTVAAVPGRITSLPSRGTNDLLREGAPLVRGAGDALDLLYGASPTAPPPAVQPDALRVDDLRPRGGDLRSQRHGNDGPRGESPRIEPRLRALLRRIDEGKDTISELAAEHERPDAVLRDVAELELRGLVRRGDGGRYVPCTVAPCG